VVGTSAAQHFNVQSDFVFEIGLTPNRADAMSHIGVARDLLAVLKQQNLLAQNTEICWPSVTDFKVNNTSKTIQVTVENVDACPRYAGITISNVAVAPSPNWLQNRLLSIGLTPINNIVDVTNFINHELGQPLHAFDADK